MTRDAAEHASVPGVVLHELARQLDGVPGNTVDPRDARIVHPGEQVMQAVAKLVEQRQHIVMCQESGPSLSRRQHVADQVRHRQSRAGGQALASDALIHPRAAALVGSGIGIEIEAADRPPPGALDLEEAHVRVPHGRAAALPNAHIEQPLGDLEQAGEDARQRKIRT
jgi:hypothetical protein